MGVVSERKGVERTREENSRSILLQDQVSLLQSKPGDEEPRGEVVPNPHSQDAQFTWTHVCSTW